MNQEETHCNIMVEFCSIISWPYLNSEYNIQLDPRNIATGYKIIQEDKLKPKNEFQQLVIHCNPFECKKIDQTQSYFFVFFTHKGTPNMCAN